MAATYTLQELEFSLRELVDRAASGEEMVITDGGQPKIRLVPLSTQIRRQPGGWEGQVKIHDSFEDPLPDEVLDAFEGRT